MATYRATGRETTASGSQLQSLSGRLEVERTIQVSQNVRSSEDKVNLPADPNSLVEVELDNGVVFWTSLEQLQEDAEGIGHRSADGFDLPTRYPAAGPVDRGIIGVAIKSLNFLGYKVADDIPEKAVAIAAERVEKQLAGPTGIYQIGPKGELTPGTLEAGTDPVLVFIHGTASSTTNGFKALTGSDEQAAAWDKLQEHYKGRVFGYEHRTLTQFPAENAVEFLENLPDGEIPPLHLVSHSRGGLVGDLIAHGGLKETVFPVAVLKAAGIDEQQIPVFNRLNELLATKAPKVTRFVRIACPAGGTTLASGRLDIYLSLMFTLLGKIPAVGPILGAVGDLLATAAKLRTDPDALPGLEAQMPNSPFIRVLNGSGHQLDSDLTVISGDSDGWLKNLANLFYWTANDLVVDTRSMYRGAVRANRSWYRAEGSEVHHCNYFARDETVTKLIDGLTRSDTSDGGFAITEPRSVERGALHPTAPEDGSDQPGVILIPGVMGSHLSVPVRKGRNRIWLDISDVMKGGIDQLGINAEGVVAGAVVGIAYANLADYLREQNLHVIPFPYDWRISLADSAMQLRDLVKKRQKASDKPLTLVTHSMGGIVARHFIADCQQSGHEEWNGIVSGGGRLIQLGTPNGGSYLIPYLLQGKEKILKYLAALDFRNSRKDWVKLIARYPGLHEMSPQSSTRDFFKVSTWKGLKVLTKPLVEELTAAKSVVEHLNSVELSDHPVVYVAGKADLTPDMQAGDDEIKFTQRGDGRVTWESGIPKGVNHWFINTSHGDLANHKKSFPGLLDLINTGTTQQLSTQEPQSKRQVVVQRLSKDDDVQVFPTQESIEKAALGMSDIEDWQETDSVKHVCNVKVVHGDLAYARFPVMVGHYAGDPILHAEKALDRSIGGILSKRHQLELYPRAIGSHEVVLTPSKAEVIGKGALVVGLGDVGDLTPGGLSATVEAAVVRYATMNSQEERITDSGGLGLSTLLIGSGETGLSLEQVIESILQGVRIANQRLANAADESTLISEIEFLEIYEDVAIQALHVLQEMEGTPSYNCRIATDLKRSDGGRRRAAYSGSPGWWTPLAIESDREAGVLNFEAGGKRARVASETIHVQNELIQQMLQRPLSSEGANKLLRHTLFELLLPRVLKLRASEKNNLLLVVDDHSARYPWEMLVDRLSAEGNPLSVQAGLVRKLKVPNPPQVVHPESKTALVVGDPPSDAAPLPGAETEAIEVANRLAESWHVTRQIRHDPDSRKSAGQSDIDARSIMGAAMTGDYRILHLAGHGIYNPDDPTRSGMVIGNHRNREDFVLLTPAEVAQMRCMPELVFINCCHLGRIESTPQHLLAANLATEFIKRGVKAVVAAGWAVDDNPALCFAGKLYEQMFEGRNFGDAVLKARKATYDRYRDSNTWAAYQCYGDPGFSLMMDVSVRQKVTTRRWDVYVDPQEIIMELDNLHSWLQTRDGDSGNFESTAADLQELNRLVTRRNWHSDGRILTRMARVYSDIKQFNEATRFYEMAKSTESGEVTLRDLEQLANMRARHAESMAKSDPSRRRAAIKDIQTSMAELDTLLKLAPTGERWALKGSTSKRIVTTRGEVNLTSGLRQMTDAYTKAALIDRQNLYPLLNALAGVLLLGGPWSPVPRAYADNPFAAEKDFDAALKAATKLAPVLANEKLEFWTQTYGPDCQLYTALRNEQLQQQQNKIRDRYLSLLGDYGSAGERDSVTSQLGFLEHCLRWTPRGYKNAKERKNQADQLKILRESLTVWADDGQ